MRAAAILLLILGLVLSACDGRGTHTSFTGYSEGDFVLVGPDDGGRLKTLAVSEGDTVAVGAPLFTLDPRTEEAAVAAAQARLEEAEAALTLSTVALKRAKRLVQQGVTSRARLDDAQSAFDRDTATVAASRASLADARTRLARRQIASPAAGTVQEVYYRPGEYVMAGRSVVSLLPPGNLKIRFYVPEPARAALRIGQSVAVECDGCPHGLTAKISFISSEAEYTPPVIFSREERRKLLYLVEALPDGQAREIPVGQPVTVSTNGATEAFGS